MIPKELSSTDNDVDLDSSTSLEELSLNDEAILSESRNNDNSTNLELVSSEISDEEEEYSDDSGEISVYCDDSSAKITGESQDTVIENSVPLETSVRIVKSSDESQVDRNLINIEKKSDKELTEIGATNEDSVEIGRDCYKNLSMLTKVRYTR
jgi:hypothetical protein